MVANTGLQELIDTADQIAGDSLNYSKDASRLTAGWHRLDKLIMRQIIQSLYHMSWNLKDLRNSASEITGVVYNPEKSSLEDIRYDDHELLTVAMLRGRTRNWYANVKHMHNDIRRILAVLETLDVRPYRVGFIVARIYLDLSFFKDQYEQATGEKLED